MEENENKPAEITQEKVTQHVRDEILALSREENKHGDERGNFIYKTAIQIAYSIGLILTGIILIVSSIVSSLPIELMIVYTGMIGVTGLYCGIKFSKRKPLFLACGAVCLTACVMFIVCWILQLCGVM